MCLHSGSWAPSCLALDQQGGGTPLILPIQQRGHQLALIQWGTLHCVPALYLQLPTRPCFVTRTRSPAFASVLQRQSCHASRCFQLRGDLVNFEGVVAILENLLRPSFFMFRPLYIYSSWSLEVFHLGWRVANRNRVSISTHYLECVWLHASPGCTEECPLWPCWTGVCLCYSCLGTYVSRADGVGLRHSYAKTCRNI